VDYILVYAKPVMGTNMITDRVLLVLKDRPQWQEGKFNLPGGKIELGETIEEAAVRELKEETGLEPLIDCITVMGKITGSWGTVHCIKMPVCQHNKIIPREGETEIVNWVDWADVRNNPFLMPNLRVVIPLMMQGILNWEIIDEGPSWEEGTHSFSVNVLSHKLS
jgi:8-oxo-dGTP pyrophosphatase MutT (NUDIX family)